MGTQDPLVHIEAATLAGGENNQDRYAYGDGWAFVLDGASSFSGKPPAHDGGWYAERLKNALAARLDAGQGIATVDLVEDAIGEAGSAHDASVEGPCPSSTIALARWDDTEVELYILGDSFALWADASEMHELTDDRLAHVGQELRETYVTRLACGSGFDEQHLRILGRLQEEQVRHRNQQGGYWIAADMPEVSIHGITLRLPRSQLASVLLASDGLSASARAEALASKTRAAGDLQQVLRRAQGEEANDSAGQRRPRSKVHDDKTAVLCNFTGAG